MAGNYVFSTLPVDMIYTGYVTREGSEPLLARSVFIKGGAGIANDRFITEVGVRTEVSDEELQVMLADHTCKLHMANGYITLQKKSHDVEKVAADMKRGDKSSPLEPTDFDLENDEITAIKPVLDEKIAREIKKNKNK